MFRKVCSIKLAAPALICALATAANAATLRVDDSAPNGGDGSTWPLAINNLQTAFTDADPGDEIWVAQGTYKPTTGTARTVSFVMEKFRVFGGYIGYNHASPNTRDPALYPTILSGDIGTASDNSDNSYHVVTFNELDMDVDDTRLDGFTVRDGNADGVLVSENRGAGLCISGGASPRVHNCLITENDAKATQQTLESRGCGVYSSSASPVLTLCTLSANEMTGASYGGGAAADGTGTLRLISCTISATRRPGARGSPARRTTTPTRSPRPTSR